MTAAAIKDYDDLVAECQDWLFGRADIALKVPSFIRLAEAKLNRVLKCRQMEGRATATVNLASNEPEFITLPGDFHSMRRVRLSSVAGKPRLKFASGAQLDDLREKGGNVARQPVWFSIFGDEIELCPTPDAAYVVEMIYRKYLEPLSSDNQQNWLLDFAPDAYLYGALMEAAPYLHEDERIAVWSSGLEGTVKQLNDLSEEATFNAGPLVIRRKGRGYR
jgi:hypothetical protein